jgi:succinyl-CoA synthetase beta subunit
MVSSFSVTLQKTKQKKTPVSRLTLRVAVAVGARGNSPAVGALKQSARLFPSATAMLGAGQREKKYIQKLFFKPFLRSLPLM